MNLILKCALRRFTESNLKKKKSDGLIDWNSRYSNFFFVFSNFRYFKLWSLINDRKDDAKKSYASKTLMSCMKPENKAEMDEQ